MTRKHVPRKEYLVRENTKIGLAPLKKKRELDGPVRVRPATEADINFIFSSWLKSYRDSFFAATISTTVYYAEHHKVVERLLKSCEVYVACSDADTSELYGFVCGERVDGILVIHYAYVKHHFRWLGIGRKLFEQFNHDGTSAGLYTHLTKSSRPLASKFGFVHSPYIALTSEYRTEEAAPLSPKQKEELYGEEKESIGEPNLQRIKVRVHEE